jgi:nucleoid DNA-binding protein
MVRQTRNAAIEATQATIMATRPARPGRVARTGSGSRIPAKVAPAAAASKPMVSQILASPP